MELITVDDVKTRMGLPSELLDADDSIESAIAAATEYIVSILDSPLIREADRSDTFFTANDQFPNYPGDLLRLRLRQMNVDGNTVSVSSGDGMNSVTAMSSSEFSVDLAKGVVYVPKTYVDTYFTVTYTAGYDNPDDVPMWLKDSILAYVPGILNSHQTTRRKDEYKVTIDECRKVAAGILAPHMRGTAFHYRPIF